MRPVVQVHLGPRMTGTSVCGGPAPLVIRLYRPGGRPPGAPGWGGGGGPPPPPPRRPGQIRRPEPPTPCACGPPARRRAVRPAAAARVGGASTWSVDGDDALIHCFEWWALHHGHPV